MKHTKLPIRWLAALAVSAVLAVTSALGAQERPEDFGVLVRRLQGEKSSFAERHRKHLEERYDLSDRPVPGVTMSRGKPVQGGVRVKLPAGQTWEQLAGMTPEDIKSRDAWPAGFYPLPH